MTTLAKRMTLLIADMVGKSRESFFVGTVRDALLPARLNGEITTSKAETS